MKIALLLPRSTTYRRLSADIMNGWRFGIQEHNAPIEMVFENIGAASLIDPILEKVDKVLLEDQVDGVVLFCNSIYWAEIAAYFEENRKFLLLLGTGASIPQQLSELTYVNYHSLDLWLSMWALGEYVESKGYSRMGNALHFLESGYHFQFAFLQGYGKPGKELLATAADLNASGKELVAMAERQLQELDPDFLLIQAFGTTGNDMLESISQSEMLSPLPLFATPFINFEQKAIPVPENSSLSWATTWSPNLKSEANTRFCEAYDEEFEDLPNALALLGYEAALLLHRAIEQAEKTRPKAVSQSLKNLGPIETPRGMVSWNNDLNCSSTEIYLEQKLPNEAPTIQETLSLPQLSAQEIDGLNNIALSGFTNPYLCS